MDGRTTAIGADDDHRTVFASNPHSMDRWRTWNAQKLPGRAVNRFVRGWVGTGSRGLAAIEVHRTACIVTHPPGGELSNDALVNPANVRLHGTRFTPEECWTNLHGDPTGGRWDKELATFPFQAIDGLVSEFGGAELRSALEAVPEDAASGERCAVGNAVVTPTFDELRELYGELVHAVPPQYRDLPVPRWASLLDTTYRAAFDAAHGRGFRALAVPLLGSGAKGAPKAEAMRVAAEAAVGWQAPAGEPQAAGLTVRFGVQDSSLAHALVEALESAMRDRLDGATGDAAAACFERAAPPEGERWALQESHA